MSVGIHYQKETGELTVYTTGSLDTVGDIQDDTGTAFGDADQRGKGESNNFRIVHNAKPGTYYISVHGNQNATGTYTLHASFVLNEEQFAVQPEGIVVDPEGIGADPDSHHNRANAISLTLGCHTTGTTLSRGDTDYFLVQVPTPRTIIAETGWRKSGESPDLIGELQDRNGNRIADNDDGGFDRNFRIVRHVGPGTHYIKVRGFNNNQVGAYTFYVHDNVNEPGPRWQSAYTLPLNRSVGEAITFYGDIDYYRISVPAYGKLVVETTGSTDTYGQLRNSSDSLVTSNDDGGTGTNFRISRSVTSGTYYIRVSSYGSRTGTYTLLASIGQIDVDVNGDDVVNVADLVVAATNYGRSDASFAQGDVNGDNTVDRADIMAILDVLDDDSAGAPSVRPAASLQRWIDAAKQLNNTDLDFQKGIAVLEQLLAQLIEAETIPTVTPALPNYPNLFNPETWIPYQLAEAADVTVTIYDVNGHVVRYLDVGHQRAGVYHSRSRATHWDGRNAHGESVPGGWNSLEKWAIE